MHDMWIIDQSWGQDDWIFAKFQGNIQPSGRKSVVNKGFITSKKEKKAPFPCETARNPERVSALLAPSFPLG